MLDQPTYQTNNLKTFSILFLVKGILNLLVALFFLAYAFMGTFFMNLTEIKDEMDDMPFNPGIIVLAIGLIGFVISLVFAILTMITSKYIKEQKNYTFIFVMAILNCLTGVLGILLGVFTIIELNKPEVKELFQHPKRMQP